MEGPLYENPQLMHRMSRVKKTKLIGFMSQVKEASPLTLICIYQAFKLEGNRPSMFLLNRSPRFFGLFRSMAALNTVDSSSDDDNDEKPSHPPVATGVRCFSFW